MHNIDYYKFTTLKPTIGRTNWSGSATTFFINISSTTLIVTRNSKLSHNNEIEKLVVLGFANSNSACNEEA